MRGTSLLFVFQRKARSAFACGRVLLARGSKRTGSDPHHAWVQAAQFGRLPMRCVGRNRKIIVVVGELEHLAQIKLGVVAQTCTGISGGMFALGDAKFPAVEPIRLLTRSVGHAHKKSALIVFFGESDQARTRFGLWMHMVREVTPGDVASSGLWPPPHQLLSMSKRLLRTRPPLALGADFWMWLSWVLVSAPSSAWY